MKIIETNGTEVFQDGISFEYFNKVRYSNVVESPLPEWDASKTDYKIEDEIYNPILRRIYKCGVDGSMKQPWLTSEWKDAGAENKEKMHDQTLFTKTESNEDIEVHYETKYESHFVVFGMENIASVKIDQVLISSGELLETKDVYLRDYGVDTFSEYCYSEIEDSSNYAFEFQGDRPLLLKIKFMGEGTRKIGAVFIGNEVDYGCVFKGSTIGSKPLSQFVDNGLVTYFKGSGIIKRLKGTLSVHSSRLESLDKKLDSLSGKLSVFWLNDDEEMKEMGMLLGYSTGHTFPVNGHSMRKTDFEIVGIRQ